MSAVFPPEDDCPKCGAWRAFAESSPAYTRRLDEAFVGMGTRFNEWIAFPCRDCGYDALVPTADAKKPAEARS